MERKVTMGFRDRVQAAWDAAQAATRPERDGAALDLQVPRSAAIALDTAVADLPAAALEAADILITGRLDIAGLRHPGVITEYLAPPEAYPKRHSPDEVAAYLARRLTGMSVKWNLARIVVLDTAAAAVVAEGLAREPQPGREIVETVARRPGFGQTADVQDREE